MAQPSKRSALTTFTRVRLLELADLFELDLPRAAARTELIDTPSASPRSPTKNPTKPTTQITLGIKPDPNENP